VLPERQDDEARAVSRIVGVGERDAPICRRFRQDDAYGPAHRRVREFGKRRRDLIDAPQAAEIGKRDEKRMGRAGAAELAHDVVARGLAGGEGAEQGALATSEVSVNVLRRSGCNVREPRGVCDGKLP
jgi:hypothetical protein